MCVWGGQVPPMYGLLTDQCLTTCSIPDSSLDFLVCFLGSTQSSCWELPALLGSCPQRGVPLAVPGGGARACSMGTTLQGPNLRSGLLMPLVD